MRKNKRGRRVKAPEPTGLDATPERLAKEAVSILVDVPLGTAEERRGKARQFASTHLDRLHRNERLTLRQWVAGDWYRETHERCRFGGAVISAYGERIGGERNPSVLPRTESQLYARQLIREARERMPMHMRGFMDRFLLHDELPRYGGRMASRTVDDIRGALEALADHIGTPLTRAEISSIHSANLEKCAYRPAA